MINVTRLRFILSEMQGEADRLKAVSDQFAWGMDESGRTRSASHDNAARFAQHTVTVLKMLADIED